MTRLLYPIAMLLLLCPLAVAAVEPSAIFDVAARRAELQHPAFAPARKACMAEAYKINIKKLATPIPELKKTKEYGTDQSATDFSWAMMVLSGRALAGDAASERDLSSLLISWAKAKAFVRSKEDYDPYYALKRLLLPTIAAYSVVGHNMNPADSKIVHDWLDGLSRRMNATFDGDVDHNNHRYLADSVLMAWGQYSADDALYRKGIERFQEALEQANPDGGLPLETRRGARATWYMRQSLSSLTVMAEIARLHGDDLYGEHEDGKSIDTIMDYFLSAVYNPLVILPEASANYIPGPSDNYLVQEHGMLDRRSHQRHYMAFTEAYLRYHPESFAAARLRQLMDNRGFKERPLIDEFSGGNATCFWWKPGGKA